MKSNNKKPVIELVTSKDEARVGGQPSAGSCNPVCPPNTTCFPCPPNQK